MYNFFSVPNGRLAAKMNAMGYETIHIFHLPDNEHYLPPPVSNQERTRGPRAPASPVAPAQLSRVPGTVPSIYLFI